MGEPGYIPKLRETVRISLFLHVPLFSFLLASLSSGFSYVVAKMAVCSPRLSRIARGSTGRRFFFLMLLVEVPTGCAWDKGPFLNQSWWLGGFSTLMGQPGLPKLHVIRSPKEEGFLFPDRGERRVDR